jgi:hypothetical protein
MFRAEDQFVARLEVNVAGDDDGLRTEPLEALDSFVRMARRPRALKDEQRDECRDQGRECDRARP